VLRVGQLRRDTADRRATQDLASVACRHVDRVLLVDRAHDHRHEQAAQLDRLRERVDVLCVELADVLANADLVERERRVCAGAAGRGAAALRHRRPPLVDGPGPGLALGNTRPPEYESEETARAAPSPPKGA
jgi:hypothetical protein